MMLVECDEKFNHSNKLCRTCNGRGMIELYREDLEEYEDATCVCQKNN